MKLLKILPILFFINICFAQQTIKDLTVNDLKVVSTTKGSKPCPLMTTTQRDAIVSPINGQCVYNTTTLKLNIHNGTTWKAAGGGVDAWVTATTYSVGDLVIESNKIYKCLTAHTSGTFATDLAATKWIEVSSGVADHTLLTNIGTNTHAQIDTHIAATANSATATLTNKTISGLTNTLTNITATTNANLTGHVTSTGNAAILGSFSSSNLLTALTDKTGTGVNVFATSPTLVTPVLGVATGTSLALGGSLNANAVLDVQSTTKAFMPPRMTSAQMLAIASPTAGMVIYNSDVGATATYNGTIWVYGFGNISGDQEYVAEVSSTGVVTAENRDFINGNCVVTSTNVFTCTYNTGLITTAMACQPTIVTPPGAGRNAVRVSTSTSNVVIHTFSSGGVEANAFTLTCVKSGADYAAASASAYLLANANYDWTNYGNFTAGVGSGTINYFGTLTGNANGFPCKHRRDGGDLKMECDFTAGTVSGAGLASIILPTVNGAQLNIDTARILTTNTTSNPGKKVGELSQAGNTNANGWIVTATGTATDRVYIANNISGTTALTPALGSSFYSSVVSSIKFSVPISGWTVSGVSSLSLAGVPIVPGLSGASVGERVDSFSFSFGTTNATTACTASPCSYLDQIGTALSSITRSTTGQYSLNSSKTYLKLKCILNSLGANVQSPQPLQCSNCSALSFKTSASSSGADQDAYGTGVCQGSY